MFSTLRCHPSASSSLVKQVAFVTFVGVRRAAREVARAPGFARSVATDVRDAWRESATATVAPPASDQPPF
jgi:hypothetical protein